MMNSMDESVAHSVMMLKPAKMDTLRSTTGNEKNIARVCEIYEQLFSLRQGERSIQEHFATIRALLDELDVN